MPITTVAELLDSLRQFHLLEPTQLDETVQLHARCPDPRAIARELLERGWLTAYQINHLFQGRGHELLLGSYVLLERLGEGGMGEVFKARHQKLGRIVALKLMVPRWLPAVPMAASSSGRWRPVTSGMS